MKITVDPSTEAGGFGYAEAGRYTMRIKSVEQKQKAGSAYPYLKWEIEFSDPNVQSVPIDGKVMKVGNVFENTTLNPEKNGQFRLRQLCEAIGHTWGDFDTDDVIGSEFEAQIDIKQYEGNFSNEIKKFIPRG